MKIQTKIKKVLFRKKGSNWSILLTDNGIFKGEIFWKPKVGENIEFSGSWEAYKGEKQFNFILSRIVIPEDSKEVLKYACGLTKGLGETIALKIWDLHGEDWRNVKVNEVSGLTQERFNLLQGTIEGLNFRQEETKAITYLISKGCSIKLAQKAWEVHAIATIPKIKANCYLLADLPHIGFKQIDSTIRHKFKIQDSDILRIKAGIQYVVKDLLNGGGSYVILQILQAQCILLLNVGLDAIRTSLRELLATKILVGYPVHKAITLPEYKLYEENIFNYAKNN